MAASNAVPHLLSLDAFEGPATGSQYRPTATGNKITVGRTKASKLHIEDETVSERHGVLQWDAQAWTITDLDSSNGTAVNGVTLEPHGASVGCSVPNSTTAPQCRAHSRRVTYYALEIPSSACRCCYFTDSGLGT